MDKIHAMGIISEAANIYDTFYCNRNLLIIYGSPNAPSYIETKAIERNFLHLTGVILNKSLMNGIRDKNANAAEVFFQKAKSNRLSEDDFELREDGTTEQKMHVLVHTLNVSDNIKMIGDYAGWRINLKTDKIAGSINAFLGFIKNGKYYYPNTVMCDDLRKNTRERHKILAILSKKISSDKYDKIEMTGKKIDISRLLKRLEKSVPIADELLHEKEPAGIV